MNFRLLQETGFSRLTSQNPATGTQAKSKIQNRPSLAYGINFSTPGTYTLWLRGYASNARGDSAYVGFVPRSWSWAKASTTLPVTQTGVLTLNIWMREDGLRLDRLVLTTDTAYLPNGFGLAETERLTGTNGLELTVNQVIQYEYDHLYRLTEADYSTGALYEYDYDPVGNRLAQIINGDTTSYQYDAANRLEAVSHQAVTQTYTFDDNGNLLNTGVMTNSFDAANRLVSSSRSEVTVQPLYNGVGDRVGQTIGTTTTTFALDVQGLPEVIYTSEGDLYLHLPGVIMTEKAGEVRYLLSDGLGSIRQVTDDTSAVVAYNEFDPYGNPVQNTRGGEPYGYTGEWYESYLDLLHLRARWYAPESGTFINQDPWEGDELRPLTFNGWSYVEGNPINRIDPSGYCSRAGSTDCERFVSEVRCIIEGIRNGLQECTWTWPLDETQLVIDFLAHYYSFIRLKEPIFDTFYIPGLPLLGPTSRDRWPVPDWEPSISQGRGFDWDWPINDPNSEEGKRDRQKYGFKRPYFEQTHHFFAFLKFSYHWGGPLTEWYNKKREIEDQILPAQDNWRKAAQNPDTPPGYNGPEKLDRKSRKKSPIITR